MSDHYRERLYPGPGWLVLGAALIAMIAIAYGAALGAAVGAVVAVGVSLITVIAAWRSSTTVRVDSEGIHAGRATLPAAHVESARILDATETTNVRRGLDPLVGVTFYTAGPAWAPRETVAVILSDSDDPHTSWLIPTRNPTALKAAIEERSLGEG